ncbi:MAG: aminopeptidase P family protein [Alphaproteobacteria bacterium]|nr:aminopeptidase P family protein [Alphaproteobacteria bacterium]
MKEKILDLRSLLYSKGLEAYIIPSSDEFLSEYPPLSFKRLEYICGFSCSNGYLIVFLDKLLFITDSRYTTIALEYFSDSELCNINEVKTTLSELEKLGVSCGYNPRLFSKSSLSIFQGLNLVEISPDLVDQIWHQKPLPPATTPFLYKNEYRGEDTSVKIQKLRSFIKSSEANGLIISSPESVCWLLNVRAKDNEFSPIMLSHLYLSFDRVILFTNKRDVTNLTDIDLEIRSFEEMDIFLGKIEQAILVPLDSSVYVQSRIPLDKQRVIEDPLLFMRSIKNTKEVIGAKNAHIIDAVAVIEFLAWLQEETRDFTEYELGLKITEFRAKNPLYLQDSFAPIVGFAENGAKIHYRASKDSSSTVKGGGLLLIDSGAHYLGGTTDITRTIAIGKGQEQYKKYYTKVLKGHIALANIIFPDKNIRGCHIDVLARQYLWKSGLDYGHGTGHGVGNCLSVHEGPASISLANMKYHLKEGMILSNEPGYYQPGYFGIRIENLQYIKKSSFEGFLEFEQLTLVPYCDSLIDCEMLNQDEIVYLKHYYETMNQEIAPLLTHKAKNYLSSEVEKFIHP